jgi:hypothetical protein
MSDVFARIGSAAQPNHDLFREQRMGSVSSRGLLSHEKESHA